jgi:DNA-binding transcriptional LysR family regulator
MLDLDRVHAFTVVAKHENVSRAAEELHISQSPLSRQVLALEAELGVQLFTRTRKRLRLTAEGRAFLADAHRLLEHAAAVEARRPTPLTVGYVPAAVHGGALPRDLDRWRRKRPEQPIRLRAMRTSEQLDALAAGTLDVAYVHASAGLESTLVLQERFLLAAPRRGKPAALLSELPLIWTSGSAHALGELRDACASLGATPDLGIEAHDPLVVLELVAAGLGVSLVQASLRRRAPDGVRFVALPETFPLDVRVHRAVAPHLAEQAATVLRPAPAPRGA